MTERMTIVFPEDGDRKPMELHPVGTSVELARLRSLEEGLRRALKRQAIWHIRAQNNWCSGRAGLAHLHGDDFMYHYFLAGAKKYNRHLERLVARDAAKGGTS